MWRPVELNGLEYLPRYEHANNFERKICTQYVSILYTVIHVDHIEIKNVIALLNLS